MDMHVAHVGGEPPAPAPLEELDEPPAPLELVVEESPDEVDPEDVDPEAVDPEDIVPVDIVPEAPPPAPLVVVWLLFPLLHAAMTPLDKKATAAGATTRRRACISFMGASLRGERRSRSLDHATRLSSRRGEGQMICGWL
jgi:hypothetical protein